MLKRILIAGVLPVGVFALLVITVVAVPPLSWEGSFMVGAPGDFSPEGWARWMELPSPLQQVPEKAYLEEWFGQCVHWFDVDGADMGNARVRNIEDEHFMFVTWADQNQTPCETFNVYLPEVCRNCGGVVIVPTPGPEPTPTPVVTVPPPP